MLILDRVVIDVCVYRILLFRCHGKVIMWLNCQNSELNILIGPFSLQRTILRIHLPACGL